VKTQVKSNDGRVRLDLGQRRANLFIEGKKVDSFDVLTVRNLTAAAARELQRTGHPGGSRELQQAIEPGSSA